MSHSQEPPTPLLELSKVLPTRLAQSPLSLLLPGIERFLGVDYLNASYDRVRENTEVDDFFERALRSMDLAYSVSDEDLAKIPTEGPLFIVSNHPFGGVDGVVLGAMLSSIRKDYKLLANYLLGHMEAINPWLIGVDPFEGKDAAKFNLKALKEAIRFVREGGCIGTFPSGTVSHFHARTRQVTDPTWNTNIAGLIRRTGASVVPVYFDGTNSKFFQAMGVVHPRMRTVLLPREMKRLNGRTIHMRIGNAITHRKLTEFGDDKAMTEFLRLNTYILGKRHSEKTRAKKRLPRIPKPIATLKPLIEPVATALLKKEIEQLPAEQCLVEHGNYNVFYALPDQIPSILREIGRLREQTFREVHEGTGEPLDLDKFDQYYRHLFLWDRETEMIVGAYRLGMTDLILKEHGKQGLYTSTLFKYKSKFLEELNPALEVGRSFIVSSYQKKHATLSLIWRGIGQFVVRHPQYRLLFGPVSINRDYLPISRDLIVKFLTKNKFNESLSSLVKAKRPPRSGKKIRGSEKRALFNSVKSIDEVSALVSEIEKDKKGVPVLLKHYLKMNGQLLSFNVDNEFGNCLDGLILVDLTRSDPKLLRAYLGAEGSESFLDYHDKEEGQSSSANEESLASLS